MAVRPTSVKVEIPKPGEDRPKLGRVGIITVVGFALGVLWPTLAGVKLVPSAPVEAVESTTEALPAPSGDPALTPDPGQAAPGEVPAPPEPTVDQRFTLGAMQIISCRTGDGGRRTNCGELDLSSMMADKLKALAACPGTEEARGMLSLGLEVNFAHKKVTEVLKGRSTTLPDPAAETFLECAKKEFATASVDGVKHEFTRYTVFYPLDIVPTGQSAAPPEAPTDSASGRATVSWEVAIIRDAPKDGTIVARVLRGTNVTVTGRQNDWYRVKYDAKGGEGWVFKTAIGM